MTNDLPLPSLSNIKIIRYNNTSLWEERGFFVIKDLFDKDIFIYSMLGLGALSGGIKLVLAVVYQVLGHASKNMGATKNKLIKSMKRKFEAFYKLKIGVHNVDIFVDKYILQHKFCGILLSTWENICGQLLILCVLIGSAGSILGVLYECGKNQILTTFVIGLLVTGMLIILESMLNIHGKKERIALNMKDYLENYLKVKLEQGLDDPKLLEEFKSEIPSPLLEEAASFTAVTKEYNIPAKNKKLSKFEQKKKQKVDKHRKLSEAKRMKQLKKEEKKRNIELKKEGIRRQKQESKEESLRIKREAKAALERKKEEERLEIERIKAEVRSEAARRKEEKRSQEEIKSVLSLEKQLNTKTIAQEKKESLLREVGQRRNRQMEEGKRAEEIPFHENSKAKQEVAIGKEILPKEEEETVDKNMESKEKLQFLLKNGVQYKKSEDDKVIADILKEFLA